MIRPIWVDIEYTSIFGGKKEIFSGLTDNIIICVRLDTEEVIGYYIEPKSIVVKSLDELPEDIEDHIRIKITNIIKKAEEYVVQNYGIKPVKYKVLGADEGILYVIAYLSEKPESDQSIFYDVEAIVFKFDYKNLTLLSAKNETITIVDTMNFQNQGVER